MSKVTLSTAQSVPSAPEFELFAVKGVKIGQSLSGMAPTDPADVVVPLQKVILQEFKAPRSPPALSQICRDQSPFTSTPAKASANVPPSGENVPVKGAEPVVIDGAPSTKTVLVQLF